MLPIYGISQRKFNALISKIFVKVKRWITFFTIADVVAAAAAAVPTF